MSTPNDSRLLETQFRVWRLLVIAKLSLSWKDLCWVSTDAKGFRKTYFFAFGRVTAPDDRETRHIRPWFLFVGPLAVKAAWITLPPEAEEAPIQSHEHTKV
jgi:hypothetical protein